jgi:hypothetical protein
MNKGLPENLKVTFSYISPETRPLVKPADVLNPY